MAETLRVAESGAKTHRRKTNDSMALEVSIEKQLRGFRLAATFTAADLPLGLMGSSGSGKSMTLRMIAGLEAPDQGRIVLHGRVLFDSRRGINVPPRARRVGLLFQNYALFPHLSVAENVAFGLHGLPEDQRLRRVAEQLAAAHLEEFAGRFPGSLSGGEQQRVALARALAVRPEALLLDEPFSALDTHLRSALERQLRQTLSTYGGATVFVSHNLEEAYRVCGELVVLSRGSVAASGPKEDIFRHPPTVEVARLTGCKNFSRARQTRHGWIEALDWGCALNVSQATSPQHGQVGIRAHHVRVRAANEALPGESKNVFPCWLAAINETPFRVTLDLRIGGPPASPGDFHVQAEIFKQQWESFRTAPQPWRMELAPDLLFCMPH